MGLHSDYMTNLMGTHKDLQLMYNLLKDDSAYSNFQWTYSLTVGTSFWGIVGGGSQNHYTRLWDF